MSMDRMKWLIFCVITAITLIQFGAEGRHNVLMIVVDDLRPEIEPYSKLVANDPLFDDIITPNLAAFAKDSIKFTNAFTQYPTCGPSRASFMTGRRPGSISVYKNSDLFRNNGDFMSMPQYFKSQGYGTYATGKIYHTGHDDNGYSWTEDNYQAPRNATAFWAKGVFNDESWGAAGPDSKLINRPLPDSMVLDYALDKLDAVKTSGEDFFLAVGFKKPHTPFICPSTYFDNYTSNVQLPDASLKYVAKNYPEMGWSGWLDLAAYSDINNTFDNSFNMSVSDTKAIELRKAYYACVTWIDSLIGELLKKLEDLGLSDDTVVFFMSDHGFHLGEHSEWTKGTLYNLDLRVPMMLKVPGKTDTSANGITVSRLVENIDVFPTLVEATGVDPVPDCKSTTNQTLCHEGLSLYRYVNDKNAIGKSYALSQYYKTNGTVTTMGYSIRTLKYHYVRWIPHDRVHGLWDDADMYAEELYVMKDLRVRGVNKSGDPDETVNVASDPDFDRVKKNLVQDLQNGWYDALP